MTPLQSFRKEAGATLRLGFPLILAQLLQMSMNFVDTVMAGRISALDLAGVAVGSSLMVPLLVLGNGTVMAVNPIVAQNYGARRFDRIGSNARHALWISLLVAIPFFFILRNLYGLMGLIGVEEEIISIADRYLKAISWGIFPVMAYSALRYFNEGLSVTRPTMYIALVGTLANIPVNYVLMFGKLGLPRLGAPGAGYGSAIVYWLMFLLILLFTSRFHAWRRFRIFGAFRLPEREQLREMLSIGIPIGVGAAMEVTMFAVTSLMMATLGTVAVAGHQVAINFAGLTFMVPFGLSIAVTARVGVSAGRGRLEEVRQRGSAGILLSVLFMCLTAVFILLLPDLIASIYTNDPAVREMSVQLLTLAAIFQISDGLQVGAFGALRGLKDTRFPMFVNMFAYGAVGLGLSWFLGLYKELGPRGLWTGLIVGLTIAGVVHTVRFWYKTR